MKENKVYVTFCDKNNVFNKKFRYAIECDTNDKALDDALDINSYACFQNVRLNNCGRFVKNTKILNCENYRKFFGGCDFSN